MRISPAPKAAINLLLIAIPICAQTVEPGTPRPAVADVATVEPVKPAKPGWVWWQSRSYPPGQPYRAPSTQERVDLLVRGTYINPGGFGRAGLAAAIDHWQNDPPDWGSNSDGFEKRIFDRFAQYAIRDSIEAVWAGAIGHEVRYLPCNCDGAFRRTIHAVAGGFRTYNRQGEWRPHYARIGSTFGAAYIRYGWQPHATRDASDLAYETLVQLAVGSTGRIYREFSPELNRLLFGWRKKHKSPDLPSGPPVAGKK